MCFYFIKNNIMNLELITQIVLIISLWLNVVLIYINKTSYSGLKLRINNEKASKHNYACRFLALADIYDQYKLHENKFNTRIRNTKTYLTYKNEYLKRYERNNNK